MSNFKKVILFVSMIAVLVSSLMLPTFADDADYPLTDPYREGYNKQVVIDRLDPIVSSSGFKSNYQQSWSLSGIGSVSFRVVIVLNDGAEYVYTPVFTQTPGRLSWYLNNSSTGYYRIYAAGTTETAFEVRSNFDGTVSFYDKSTGSYGVVATYYSVDVADIQVRTYCENYLFSSSYSSSTAYSSGVYTYFNNVISREFVDYSIRESVYSNGIIAGIQQGYQNGFDEGYQEGFASAGGSFADIVSNPDPGYGLPDVQIDIQPKPQDYIFPEVDKLTILARFATVGGVIERVSDGENMIPGKYSMVLDWLGNESGDPVASKGYRIAFYNEDGSIHGTLWFSMDTVGDGSQISQYNWYWFSDYYMNGSFGVAPYRVNPRNVQAWVHGDSTALLESKPLTDDGFYITYPYMGEEFYTNGYNRGYGNGLKDGFDGADTSQAWMNLKDTIFVIFDAPFYVISQSLNFDLFGINIAGAIISIISVALIVFILTIIIVRLF